MDACLFLEPVGDWLAERPQGQSSQLHHRQYHPQLLAVAIRSLSLFPFLTLLTKRRVGGEEGSKRGRERRPRLHLDRASAIARKKKRQRRPGGKKTKTEGTQQRRRLLRTGSRSHNLPGRRSGHSWFTICGGE